MEIFELVAKMLETPIAFTISQGDSAIICLHIQHVQAHPVSNPLSSLTPRLPSSNRTWERSNRPDTLGTSTKSTLHSRHLTHKKSRKTAMAEALVWTCLDSRQISKDIMASLHGDGDRVAWPAIFFRASVSHLHSNLRLQAGASVCKASGPFVFLSTFAHS